MGLGLLLDAVALGLYSRFLADTVPLYDLSNEVPVVGVAERLGLCAAIMSAIVLAAGVVNFAAARRGDIRFVGRRTVSADSVSFWAISVVVVVLVAVIGVGLISHPLTVYGTVRSSYPYFPRLPAAMAAYVLAAVGTLSALVGILGGRRMHGRSARLVSITVALGVLVSVGVSTAAIRAGDDNVNIDHTTAAAAAEIPALPTALGTKHYRLFIPDDGSGVDIVVAGRGPVIGTGAGITAYDGATGAELWRYHRREQSGQHLLAYVGESLISTDGGAVVIAGWHEVGLIAFDAVTGEILWSDSDYTRDRRSGLPWEERLRHPNTRVEAAPGPLVLTHPTRISRYDPRTGKRLWLTDTAYSDCGGPQFNAAEAAPSDQVTDNGIYRAQPCSTENLTWWRITAIDPQRGTVIGTRDIDHQPTSARHAIPRMRKMANTMVVSWPLTNTWRDYAYLVLDSPDQLETTPITDNRPVSADPFGSDVLLERWLGTERPRSLHFEVAAIGSDTARYTVEGIRGMDSADNSRIFLTDELVEFDLYQLDSGFDLQIRAWRRTDGSPSDVQSIERDGGCSRTVLLAVPSALLAVCHGTQDVAVIGFTQQ
ncbi:PQQ-like beta-propeller repeat protein [Nocardia otitidiscaviarum]|uniref:outer membrane protein assembly factor BamB family protein n=1 Tax=Nocardia otitidiscaviarum TaxID=1823 RepID=UPI00163D46C1|nr:PQQ-binding-like beta-propeller repeat protein [Nocardia otitidiscaviarum]MCP9622928.1 PQQ-like beta-propeller repeat protein [Nocardia otitidiscaviarum]